MAHLAGAYGPKTSHRLHLSGIVSINKERLIRLRRRRVKAALFVCLSGGARLSAASVTHLAAVCFEFGIYDVLLVSTVDIGINFVVNKNKRDATNLSAVRLI